MADNVELNTGTGGATLAADDIGGVHHQRVKIQYGTDGNATDVSDSNPLPIDDAGAAITIDHATLDNAHVADFDTGAGTDNTSAFGLVVPASGGAAVIPGSATAGLKVDLGADNDVTVTSGSITANAGTNLNTSALALESGGNLATLAGTVVGSELQVDIVSSTLPSGAATSAKQDTVIGHLDGVETLLGTIDADTSALAATVDGSEVQVDVVSSALPSGAATSARQDSIIADTTVLAALSKAEDSPHSSTDTGIMALAVRRDADTTLVDTTGDYAPLQVDANGYLKVEIFDGGGSHTVDGTVTANAGTDLNTSLLALEAGGNLAGAATSLAILDDWDESDRAKVNPIVGQAGVQGGSGSVSNTTQRVVLATDVALPAGTNAIGKLSANSGVDIGDVDVTSIAAGTNLIGNVGIGVRTTGGVTPYQNLDVDETEDEVKGSAGQVYFIHAMNLANAKRYLKFYNDTAANVSVGSTTPVLTFTLPTQGDTNGAGFTLAIPNGIAFSAAITIAATTGFAVADTGAPGANEIIVNLGYA